MEGKIRVGGAEACDEVVFEGSDGPFLHYCVGGCRGEQVVELSLSREGNP